MVKAKIGDHTIEVWFTPSYKVKSDSKELAHYLRQLSYRVYDPIRGVMRNVRIDKSELDAFLLIQHIKFNTNVEVEFFEVPRALQEQAPEGAVQ